VTAIILATLNAKYIHASLGLRYLAANMGPLADQTAVLEFTIDQRPLAVAEAILAQDPSIVGLGVYIWNVELSRQVFELLRCLAPELTLVVGGPEVSHELDDQAWLGELDYVITGEADEAFPTLCARVLGGRRPLQRVIAGGLPDLETLRLPYPLYETADLGRRMLYVEASRGCPYRCEFCLSSLDKKVRAFPLEPLLEAFDALMVRGARNFKFVDRTFNLDLRRSAAILEYFLARIGDHPDLFLHFEMVPDRLPDGLRALITRFPAGALQFEIGIQSLDPEVGARIQRRQDLGRTFENLRFLREETGAHLHTDLIIGLPGEGLEGFAAGLDRLIDAGVQEVQVGVLKRLRGTPIARHAEAFGMVFEPRPPNAILRSELIDFATMQRLKRFAQVWDTFWNRGQFPSAMAHLFGRDPAVSDPALEPAPAPEPDPAALESDPAALESDPTALESDPTGPSPFARTLAFSDWLFATAGRVYSIALPKRARYLAAYLVEHHGLNREQAQVLFDADFERAGRSAPTLWIEPRSRADARTQTQTQAGASLRARQTEHLRHA